MAGLACCVPGHRSRLICRLHSCRRRKDEIKAFTWIEYQDLLIAAQHQSPGRSIVQGIWSVLKRGVLANLAVTSFAHLIQVIRHVLKKIQCEPRLIAGYFAGAGLTLDQY